MKHPLTVWLPALLLLLTACSLSADPAEPPPEVNCPAPPPVEVLTDGWRFSPDPNDVGLAERWYEPGAPINQWDELPIGRAWEQAAVEYDGIGWYAREISWDGPQAYLFLADADDSATVWVDGEEVAALGQEQPSAVLTLDNPDGRAWVAIRVLDEGGFGGIKSPPRLSPTADGAPDEARLIDLLESQAPHLPPAPSGDAWMMIGGVDEADEALIAIEGSLSPWASAPSAEVWLRNSATGEIARPLAGGQFALIEHAPVVSIRGEAGEGVTVDTLTFYDETDGAVRWRVAVERPAAEQPPGAAFDELIIALRPYRVNRTLAPFCNPVPAGETDVWLNNAPFLAAETPPASFTVEETWAGLVYPLSEGATTLDFALPAAPGRDLPSTDVNIDARLDETLAAWRARQTQARISLPDATVQAALDASLGYLLLAGDPDGPHPGPLAHNAIWTRDAAYMGLALLMRGHADVARSYAAAVLAGQEPDGRVPPIQGDAPWDNDEWDAQGQAITLATQVYRYTDDTAFLEQHYPAIRLAADYLIALREQTAADPPTTQGLLPPSLSAEDLVDGEQHTYWDNFWAVVGLEQAASAADALGQADDAARWRAESADLRQAIERSLETVMGSPVPYVPASVETTDNSGMARGTSPALHPIPIVAPDDSLMTRAFDYYAGRWITPYNGGYLHREGQFWTYGGVELANVYLRQNRGDLVHQILGWTLNHQTLPGAFAWAEQVDPNDFTFSGGDMPHAWMAASLTILIRNMLVLENARGPDDDALTLFQTAPMWWFEGDRAIVADDLPTPYGNLSLESFGDLRTEDGRWRGALTLRLDGAEPPGGFRWLLPFAPASVISTNGAVVDGTMLSMPGPGDVTLRFD